MDGAVEIVHDAGDSEMVLGTVGKGDMFGEMALIENKPRIASARAANDEPALVLAVSREMFEKKIGRLDPFTKGLIKFLSERVRQSVKSRHDTLAGTGFAPTSKLQLFLQRADRLFSTRSVITFEILAFDLDLTRRSAGLVAIVLRPDLTGAGFEAASVSLSDGCVHCCSDRSIRPDHSAVARWSRRSSFGMSPGRTPARWFCGTVRRCRWSGAI